MSSDVLRVRRAPRLETEIVVPGDKSISHRAIMLAALSNGVCKITNFLEGEDCLSTIKAFQQLGVTIERPDTGLVVVYGSHGKLIAPEGDIDCGNSGTTMRLLSGILAATALCHPPYWRRFPLQAADAQSCRTTHPNGGKHHRARSERLCPACHPWGATAWYHLQPADGQRPSQERNSLRRSLRRRGHDGGRAVSKSRSYRTHARVFSRQASTRGGPDRAEPEIAGCRVSMLGQQQIESRDFAVPGDISSAAFWLVTAACQPGSRLLVKNVGLNPTRTGILDVLVRMGARVREVVESVEEGEPSGIIDIKGDSLTGTVIEGSEVPNVIDELPILAVAGALAQGRTTIRGREGAQV